MKSIEILLIEDNPGDVDLAREALETGKVRNTLHVVGDGEAAMAFLRGKGQYASASRPDLILLDLNLPKKDGQEVLAEIKSDVDFIRETLPDSGSVSFPIESVARLAEALTRLESKGIDLVLLDRGLPDSLGLATFHKLQEAVPDVPVVVLTGTDDQELAVAAVRDGAQDYLVKGQVQKHLLILATRFALVRKRIATAVQEERRRFNDILDKLPVMICLMTPDYHVPFANRRFREPFGEAHDRRCFEYISDRTEPCPECQSFTPLKTHAPHHWERTTPNGTCIDIYDFPFTDADGLPLILEMDIGITERKRMEAALCQQAQELRARNEELTRFNRAMVGRELRMIELKQEVNELCGRSGKPLLPALDLPPGGILPPGGERP